MRVCVRVCVQDLALNNLQSRLTNYPNLLGDYFDATEHKHSSTYIQPIPKPYTPQQKRSFQHLPNNYTHTYS